MDIVLTSVVFNEQHEFAVLRTATGRMMASYVLKGHEPPDSETRYELRHSLNCLFNAEVDVYWRPSDIQFDMNESAQRLMDIASAIRDADL